MARRATTLSSEYPETLLSVPITAEAIGCAAQKGDALAMRVLEETAEVIGAALGSMISLLDPEIIVIGGGVAQIGEPLFSRLRTIAPRCTINQFASETPIVPAHLAGQVGILGAAAVALELVGS
jgi:glucokinase